MQKVKKGFFSEKGMRIVNALFLLSFALPGEDVTRSLYMVYRRSVPLSGHTQQFIAFVRDFYQKV